DQPGDLREPGRSVAAQERTDRFIFAHHSADCLEHGHVRFRRTELLQALTAGDRHGLAPRNAGHEVLNERRLPGTGFARDEYDLAIAVERRSEPLFEQRELGSAAD